MKTHVSRVTAAIRLSLRPPRLSLGAGPSCASECWRGPASDRGIAAERVRLGLCFSHGMVRTSIPCWSGLLAFTLAALALTNCDPGSQVKPPCQPLLSESGMDTGFDTCDDGTRQRRAAIECPAVETSSAQVCGPCVGPYCCASDADCTQEPNGLCANAHQLKGVCGCIFGCRKDADCGPGSICECGSALGQCRPATCTKNDDCGHGFSCLATSTSVVQLGGNAAAGSAAGAQCTVYSGTKAYACETPADLCGIDEDCHGGGCVLVGDHRECLPSCPV